MHPSIRRPAASVAAFARSTFAPKSLTRSRGQPPNVPGKRSGLQAAPPRERAVTRLPGATRMLRSMAPPRFQER